ncbi:MAG: hypothetical protein WC453_00280 [Patescibacteria group bacterium]
MDKTQFEVKAKKSDGNNTNDCAIKIRGSASDIFVGELGGKEVKVIMELHGPQLHLKSAKFTYIVLASQNSFINLQDLHDSILAASRVHRVRLHHQTNRRQSHGYWW